MWIDGVKGLSIILVTLYHAGIFGKAIGYRVDRVLGLSDLLTPIQMPLFFMAAGLTSAGLVKQSWSVLWGRRISLYVWLFSIWLVLNLFFFSVLSHPRHPLKPPHWSDLGFSLILPDNELWFLWCLSLFYIVVRTGTGRVGLLLGVALGLSMIGFVTSEVLHLSHGTGLPLPYRNGLKYLIFFSFAAYHRDRIISMVTGQVPLTAVLAGGYLAFALLKHFTDGTIAGGLFKFAAAIIGVVAASNLMLLMSKKTPALAAGFAWLGRRTLPIYLLQAPLITLIYYSLGPIFARMPPLVLPFIVVALFIPVALTFQDVAMRFGLNWLYSPPTWLRLHRQQRVAG